MHEMAKRSLAVMCAALLGSGAEAAKIDFNRQIRPILSDKCYACHGPAAKKVKGGYRASDREASVKSGVIVPGKPSESMLVERIFSTDHDEIMPPEETQKPLTTHEKDLLKQWIAEGAEYQEHWAFVPPKKAAIPAGTDHPIDAFVNRRLKEHGLKGSTEARREVLIRRLSFDITGLPPTPTEVDAFVADKSDRAYEKLVDRLLASERFGERMALHWMDAGRYGDSSVMHADGPRDMWPWRDYVINAYNKNMPFDQFTTEQIAGDLLPDATVQQKVASGFNRNHATSDEGGAIAEELRVEYVVDRVATTSTVWLGLTMECGQCHEHKYDPISQEEYYSFFAYFNNTKDPGMQTRRGNQKPVVEVPTAEQEGELKKARKNRDVTAANLNTHKAKVRPTITKWLTEFREKGGNAIPEPNGLTRQYLLDETDGETIAEALTKSTAKLKGKLASIERVKGKRGLNLDAKTEFESTDDPGIKFDKPFTFAAWIKPRNGAPAAIFSKMDVKAAYRGFDFWYQGQNVGTHIINTWPKNAMKVYSTSKVPLNKWSHVTVTYDGSRRPEGVKVYLNGNLSKNKIEQKGLKATIETKAPFRVGSRGGNSYFNGELDDLRIYERALSATEISRLGQNRLGKTLAKDPKKRNAKEKKLLEDYYFETQDEKYPDLLAQAEKAKSHETALAAKVITCMIMEDNLQKPRMTYMLQRGQYDKPQKDKVIKPGVPAVLGALPEGAPPNRLGLAQWLTKPDHPLTSRVAVNRVWTLLFGEGLVSTHTDFGNQGTPPSHPELLDWLAVDFVQHGWDVKRLIKQIVTSKAYRQTSRVSDRQLQQDPLNRYYARGPRFRLPGEFIRDQALAVSGLLNGPVGGPGVKPYQPVNIWNEVSLNGGLRYKRDTGDRLYRRSMYTYWKRSAPMPNMLIFDVPTREKCVVKRPRTNTPLQALVTLNDPQFVEAARAMAERLIKEGGDSVEQKIGLAYRLTTARQPNSREIAIMNDALEEQLNVFKDDPESAKKFLEVGESKRDESIDLTEHAAWTVISQLILNLDEALTRG